MSAEQHEEERIQEEREGTVVRAGPVEINWPRVLGYYGGIGAAVAFELIEPPLALVIAVVPLFKMLNRQTATRPTRVVSQILDGAATPIGGSADPMIWLTTSGETVKSSSMLDEARTIAARFQKRRGASAQGISPSLHS